MLWQSYFIPGTGVLRNELGQDTSTTAQHRHQGRYAKIAAQFTPTPAARQAAPRPHSAGHNPPPPALPQKPTRDRAQGY